MLAKDVALDVHLAADHVVDRHLLSGVDLDAHHILLALADEALHLLGGHGQRVAHHAARAVVILEVLDLLALGVELLGRVEGDVGLAGVEQLADVFLVDVAALALAVGPILASERDALVEADAEPSEGLDDVGLGLGHEARGVSVLDAEDEVAPVLAGKQVVEQGSAHTADMQGPRGAGCKAHPHSSLFCHFACFSFWIWVQSYKKTATRRIVSLFFSA